MKKTLGIRRALILLAMGGATFTFFGISTFGPSGGGCNYAQNADYEAMFDGIGSDAIQTVSDTYFNFGTDWNTFVRTPTTLFAQRIWTNWMDTQVPDDLPNNAVVLR